MKRSLLGTGILTFALLATGSAFADHGRGHDRDHDGWRNHERAHVQHVADHDRRPPGWDHGKKTGWGDHHGPPGQAKKEAIERHERHEAWRDRERREHEARQQRESNWRERERREHEAREARERRMHDWRDRERRERERRAEWRRHHPHGVMPTHTPGSTSTPTSPVATSRPTTNAPIILPSGRRLPASPSN